MVAILDADKEGFLRSETFFMQMMGRAARHIEGHVVLYADRITGSMQRSIDETNRRRKVQEAYNKKHNITPESIVKAIQDSRLAGRRSAEALAELESKKEVDISKMDKQELKFYIDELNEQMDLASKNLEFELAARLRDKISEIKQLRRLSKK